MPAERFESLLLRGIGEVERDWRERRFGGAGFLFWESGRQGRLAKAGWRRRKSGHKRSPGFTVCGRHLLPTPGIFQKLGAFVRRHVGEFAQRGDAIPTLLRR